MCNKFIALQINKSLKDIYGSGTEKIRFSFQLYCLPIILFQEMSFKLLFICKAINLLHIQIFILKIIRPALNGGKACADLLQLKKGII
jgi:hypothetical protein